MSGLELIENCHEQVIFLNTLPLSVLDESLTAFRENIFSIAGRKQIPHQIYQILEKQMIKEEHGLFEEDSSTRLSVTDHLVNANDQAALFEFSKQIYGSLQTVLEFMDKGMKGLLSGDLTVNLLLDI